MITSMSSATFRFVAPSLGELERCQVERVIREINEIIVRQLVCSIVDKVMVEIGMIPDPED